jgi:hypothetical protein
MKRLTLLCAMLLSMTSISLGDFRDSVFVSFRGDTVDIWDVRAEENCDALFAILISQTADSITIRQRDTSRQHTTCECFIDIRATLTGLPAGAYTAVIWRERLSEYGYPFDTVQYVGRVEFHIGMQVGLNLTSVPYQSNC